MGAQWSPEPNEHRSLDEFKTKRKIVIYYYYVIGATEIKFKFKQKRKREKKKTYKKPSCFSPAERWIRCDRIAMMSAPLASIFYIDLYWFLLLIIRAARSYPIHLQTDCVTSQCVRIRMTLCDREYFAIKQAGENNDDQKNKNHL